MSCPALAHAFLSLGDDGAEPPRRSLPAAFAAAAAATALALGVPLGWIADHPVAVLASKTHIALFDDEAAG
jgi:hypothetical protein